MTSPPPPPPKTATLALRKPTKKGRLVTLRGTLSPAVTSAGAAVLVVQGRRLGGGKRKQAKFRGLKEVRARAGVAYKVAVKLKPGRWKLRVRYRDPGVIAQATSRAVSVSVSSR